MPPLYDYQCDDCGTDTERCVPIAERDHQPCHRCDRMMRRLLAAPYGKMAGAVVQGGGPDRFTADIMGIPLKDLPPGLKTG